MVVILGAFGIIDPVALDDALEPFFGVRPFLTEPGPVVVGEDDDDGSGAYDRQDGSINLPQVYSAAGDWWEVLFTNPGAGDNHVEDALIWYINKANTSIHIASFEFNLDEVADALIAAHERGVEVQWVTDDEHGLEADEEEGGGQFAMLENAGIEIVDDQRSALMHNKFWIFDEMVVWTGSTNVTRNGTMRNNNNVLVLKSRAAARIFEREFQEMWADNAFGPTSPSTVREQDLVIGGSTVSIRFGSEDEVATLLAELLGSAQSEIRFMAFSFTHDDMGGTILQRYNNNVDVAGIFETRGSETEFSEMPFLFCAGVPVRQDGNPGIMHHKVLIIDRRIVVTGSFNFSNNADESNDENVVIVENAQIASAYLDEFDRRWSEGKVPEETSLSCP